jgi:MFS transporter, ACS family, hexuronate transporter
MLPEQEVVRERVLEDGSATSYHWVILAIIWCSHTVYFINHMAVSTLAPLIRADLGYSTTQIGFLVSAISMGSMISQIPVGALADRCGARWIMATGLIIIGLSAFLISSITSYAVMFGLLFLVGSGIGANQSPGSRAIIIWFPQRGRATGMGIKQMGITAGGALASFLLPMLALHFNSWRYPVAFAGLAAIGSAVLIFSFYRDPPWHAEFGPGETPRFGARFIGLLKNRDLMMLCFAGIFLVAAQFSSSAYFIMYASSTLSFPLGKCGFLLSLSFLGGALGRVGWSVVSDYLFMGRRDAVLALIGVVGAATYAGLLMLRVTSAPFLVYLLAIFLGLTSLGWNAVFLTRAGEIAGKELAGTATGITFVISNLGSVLGPPFFGYLVDATGGYTASWLFTGLCMMAVVMLSILGRRQPSTLPEECNA